MSEDLALVNGLVVTEERVVRGGLRIASGRIVEVGDTAGLAREAARVIDVDGCIILPGCIDPHTHIGGGDEPSDAAYVEDADGFTRDALIGGVTTVITTTLFAPDPLPSLLDRALSSLAGRAWCDYRVTSVVTRRAQIIGIPEVIERGVSSFKFFPGYVGDQARSLGMDAAGFTPDLFYLACQMMRSVPGTPLPMIHAEEPYVRGLMADQAKASGRIGSLASWADATPDWAESAQVLTYGYVAAMHDLPLYVVHVSAAPTLGVIRYLKALGLRVIGETLPSFLCATDVQLDELAMGARAKVQPPIRGATNQAGLWDGVRDGELSVIGTDSVNYSTALKDSSPFWDVRPGANVQLADTLPLIFDDAVLHRGMGLPQLSAILAGNAARAFGMYPQKGAIRVGSDADLVVLDPRREVALGVDRYQSGSEYSMWEGRKVRGMPVMTFLRGALVMEDGQIVAQDPDGRLVPSVRTGTGATS